MENLDMLIGLIVAIVTIIGANLASLRIFLKPIETELSEFKTDVNRRFEYVDARFDKIDARIDELRSEIREIDRKHDQKSDAIRQDIFYLARDVNPNSHERPSFSRNRIPEPQAA